MTHPIPEPPLRPTPWSAIWDPRHFWLVKDAEGNSVFLIPGGCDPCNPCDVRARSDVEHIIACVNEHEEAMTLTFALPLNGKEKASCP